jgi:hypothetical protein
VAAVMQAPKRVIDEVTHARILQDMQRVCEVANVPPTFVYNSMKSYCKDDEIEWVRRFNHHRKAGLGGLVFEGVAKSEIRCMAITGTLVRNFIDARMVSLNAVVSDPIGAMAPSVLVVPNLSIKSSAGKQLTAWQVQTVYDVLLTRLTANKPSVLYVQDMEELKLAYGDVFAEHLRAHFQFITA